MEFKKKLITVALILFLLPLMMAGVSVYLIGNYQSVKTQSEYGEESGIFQILANPVKILDWLTSSSYKEIHEYIKNEPYKLEKKSTLDEINSNMNSTYSYLVVRKNDEFVYVGDEEKFEKIDVELPAFINNVGEESSIVYLGGSFPCLVRQLNFLYSDMGKGSAFIVININELVPQLKLFAVEIIIICFLIITITAIVLVCWLYKSVLEPINKLSKATRRISFGDLDFEIEVEKDDQIGTIFNDFELMRIRLKSLIEEQQESEREFRELITNISHDLKTPLTAIKGYTEGILDGVAVTKERQDKYLKTIYTKAVDMTSLVDELSLYSKLDGNMIPYDFQYINMSAYFTDCMDELSVDAEAKGITFTCENECSPDLEIYMDGEQIKRVINNVVSNAIKYTNKEDGAIKVKLAEEDHNVVVSVADNGIGIAGNEKNYIFDRFYRTDASRNSKQGGTGLGLSIAKKIIEHHRGKIWVESEVNKGTTIFFTLLKTEVKQEKTNEKNLNNTEKKQENIVGEKKEEKKKSVKKSSNKKKNKKKSKKRK